MSPDLVAAECAGCTSPGAGTLRGCFVLACTLLGPCCKVVPAMQESHGDVALLQRAVAVQPGAQLLSVQ